MIVVAVMSVLLNLCQIRIVELLVSLFRVVVITPEFALWFVLLAIYFTLL